MQVSCLSLVAKAPCSSLAAEIFSKELQKRGMLKSLPPELYEAATLRSEFPDAPLSDLARRTSPPISKSGLLHRLDRILIIAENYKSKGDSQNNG